ncbi:MAG: ATP-binding cassette domain-containing protein, partial [Actinomycetota bacterium]
MSEMFSLVDLKVRFDTKRGALNAVRGATIHVAAGECLGVVGESCSGKTVMWRAAMGLLRGRRVTRQGSVTLDGTELLTMTEKEVRQLWGTKIARVFQDPMTALNPVRRIG